MNIASALIPKQDVAFLNSGDSVAMAIHKMSHHHYATIPVLSAQGHYLYSISTGDLLFFLTEERDMTLRELEDIAIDSVPIRRPMMALSIHDESTKIIDKLLDQNFVPIVDEWGIFLGIVTRRGYVEELRKNRS